MCKHQPLGHTAVSENDGWGAYLAVEMVDSRQMDIGGVINVPIGRQVVDDGIQ